MTKTIYGPKLKNKIIELLEMTESCCYFYRCIPISTSQYHSSVQTWQIADQGVLDYIHINALNQINILLYALSHTQKSILYLSSFFRYNWFFALNHLTPGNTLHNGWLNLVWRFLRSFLGLFQPSRPIRTFPKIGLFLIL